MAAAFRPAFRSRGRPCLPGSRIHHRGSPEPGRMRAADGASWVSNRGLYSLAAGWSSNTLASGPFLG